MAYQTGLLHKALKAYRVKDNQKAKLLLIELLQGDPQNAHAWYWLSQVTAQAAQKQMALEQAVKLNPNLTEAKEALALIEQQQIRQTLNGWQAELTDLYAEAKMAAQDGRFADAVTALKRLVQTNPEHENGWLALSKLSKNPELQIIALDKAISLNPQNKKGTARLKSLRKAHKNPFKLARGFESVGNLPQALEAYQQAAWQSNSSAVRKAAQEHRERVKQKLAQQNMRITSPAFTLLRMGAGPITLYGMLLLIQSGLNPLRVPLVLLFSSLFVGIGSLLLTVIHLTPNLKSWRQFIENSGSNQGQTRRTAVLRLVGFVFLIVPFLLLFLHSVNRLALYRATLF